MRCPHCHADGYSTKSPPMLSTHQRGRCRCGVVPRRVRSRHSFTSSPVALKRFLLEPTRRFMNILLLSMPDYFEHMPPVAVRMPNGALTSLAGNVDDHHRVAVADLILSHRQVRETINRLFHEFDPEVVGLSVMTFQRRTAHRIVDLVRALKPGVKIVVGGYDPSLAPDAYEGMGVDYIVRGEGEVTFRELLRALERDRKSVV